MVVLCLHDLRKLSTRCSDGSILPSLWASKLGVVRRDDMTLSRVQERRRNDSHETFKGVIAISLQVGGCVAI